MCTGERAHQRKCNKLTKRGVSWAAPGGAVSQGSPGAELNGGQKRSFARSLAEFGDPRPGRGAGGLCCAMSPGTARPVPAASQEIHLED